MHVMIDVDFFIGDMAPISMYMFDLESLTGLLGGFCE